MNFACGFELWLNLHVMPRRQKLLLWFLVTLETLACGQAQKRDVAVPAALPPGEIESSSRPAHKLGEENFPSQDPESESPAPAPASSMSPPAPFLMRWHFSHILGGFYHMKMEDTCILVYPSGRFRMEKGTRSKGERFRMRVFENSLNEDELQQLQELLDDPVLKASTHQKFGTGYPREGELTALAVSRDGRIQQLDFASYFSFDTNIVGIDPDERLVMPLQEWLKSHIEARKLVALPHAAATRCIPPPQAARP
jgi:hypothetical protein